MNNIEQLRQETLNVIADLRSGVLSPATAFEISNAIGKACLTIKLQLEYALLRKEKPSIAFLDVNAEAIDTGGAPLSVMEGAAKERAS